MPDTGSPIGTEFLINTTTTGSQLGSTTTVLADGSFVVVWASSEADGSSYGLVGQHFAADGTPIGGEFLVNTTTDGLQYSPSVSALSDGGFVVAWEADGQDGAGYGVYAQVFDADCDPVGTEFQVNTTTTDDQQIPDVTGLSGGGFVVTWTSDWQDGSLNGIYAQMYDASGNPVGDEFLVNTETNSAQYDSDIAALSDGGFVIVWTSYGPDGSFEGVFGQRYGADGSAVGDEFQVNTYWSENQGSPSVTALADGGFVVTYDWFIPRSFPLTAIYAQVFDADGNQVGDEFLVNTTQDGYQSHPVVGALPDGGFVIVWENDSTDPTGYDIFGQRYDADGNTVGGEFQINTETESGQSDPAIAVMPDGTFLVTWTSNGQDGSGAGIYGQLFDGTAAPVINPITGTAGADLLDGTNGDDSIEGLGGNDRLNGLDGDDFLFGGDGFDILNGGEGDDVLDGGDGFLDILIATSGSDTLTGGEGRDIFIVVGSTHTITDFDETEDRIIQIGARQAEKDSSDVLVMPEFEF